MAPDSMRVRLHLYRIRVIEVLVDLPERLEVVIRDLRSVVRCPFCGLKTTKVHETRRVKVKDVPRGAQRVTLIWLRRRFQCTSCGERHNETHPAIEGKMTARLARAIVKDARHLSITEIGRRYGVAWHGHGARWRVVSAPPGKPPQEALQDAARRRDLTEAGSPLRHGRLQRRDR